MSMGQTLLVAGAIWTLLFLALTAIRFFRLAPSLEGAWPWPVWIAIASPFAAALLPFHGFLLGVGVVRSDHAWLSGVIFGPLFLLSVVGVFGMFKGAPK
jgi:hypothetical protein